MTAINFQANFADMVKSGTKRQTIRKTARCRPGEKLQLYTGQRTKKCKKICDAVCTRVIPIRLTQESILVDSWIHGWDTELGRVYAKDDGFSTPDEMRGWFMATYGLPFDGWLIEWRLEESSKIED